MQKGETDIFGNESQHRLVPSENFAFTTLCCSGMQPSQS